MADREYADEYAELLSMIDQDMSAWEKKARTLRELDIFVLDNSLRESTVGQLRGHTLDNKWGILQEVKKCGFDHVIISAFSHVPRVDDAFVKQLSEKESDMSKYFAFSEIGEGEMKRDFPVALTKMLKYRIRNPIFEVDIASFNGDASKLENLRELLQLRIDYTYSNLASDAKIFVNLRDFAPAMSSIKTRLQVFEIVKFLATMPKEKRPLGIIFEEPSGNYLPAELGAWTRSVRQLMNKCDWKSAHFLVHTHKKWELAVSSTLECLANGATGVWASVCEEGAALGHACSITTVMNLVRLGNTKVLKKYNCHYLREAAINVTQITVGCPPHPKQTIYGERALDVVFDPLGGGMGGGKDQPDAGNFHSFDLCKFFGVKGPYRITTLATPRMIKDRLINLFGENEQFTEDMAIKMKEVMIADLDIDRKEEYMSAVGLAILFERAHGKLTSEMSDVIEGIKLKTNEHKQLLKEVREIWDEWDIREEHKIDNTLEFHSFYNAFMAPYFGCYECDVSKKALEAIDMHNEGKVEWVDFCVYLKWALNEYPDTATTDELLRTAFQKGLIPAMRDEMCKPTK